MSRASAIFAPYVRIDGAWQQDVVLCWDKNGTITELKTQQQHHQLPPDTHRSSGALIAGMPNLHSHAFQNAMAGLTEYRSTASDSFWSWRDLMYRFAAALTPEDIQHIAHWLYIEMLKAGYTSVCEFHYLHHQADGRPYAQQSELASRICMAAQSAGIGLTLLPVLYQYSHFGEQAPRADQVRFLNEPDQLLSLLTQLREHFPESSQRHYGVAPHSLRAVSKVSLNTLIAGLKHDFPHAPIHIHIAEQLAEVEACLAIHDARPVEYLFDHFNVDQRWCLVHATHVNPTELNQIANSGAVVGLCLSTEANLGDGIFPTHDYLKAGGTFGVGSDSHISVDWRSELRLLEYGQRLTRHERNVLSTAQQPQVADRLFDAALRGGAQASARPIGDITVGNQADFMVLDLEHPTLAELAPETWLASLVFSERSSHPIRDVYVAGVQHIKEGRHPNEDQALHHYRQTLRRLLNA